jgi:uncharacterized protein YhaN
MKTWRQKVDPSIRDHLEVQIAEAAKHVNAYKDAPDPKIAQLWAAIANISKQMFELNLRMKYLENAVKQALPKAKIETQEDRDLMKRIMSVGKAVESVDKKTKPTKNGKNIKKTLRKY